jgi:hypothetical protein
LAERVFGQTGGTEALVGAQQSPQCLASFQHSLNPKQADPHDATSMVLGERLVLSANVRFIISVRQ